MSIKLEQKTEQDTEVDEGYLLSSFISNSWRKRILLSLQAPEFWDIKEPSQRQQWGSLIHYILSMIKIPNDIDPTIEKLNVEGIIDDKEVSEIRKLIVEFINHPDVKPYFNEGLNVKSESEIILPDGHTLRPDRLVFEKDKIIVIDFKTGQSKKSHHKQIKNYQKILKDMGYVNTEGVLLYISQSNPVVKVV